MTIRFIVFLFCVGCITKLYGQPKMVDWTEYFTMVRKADSLYNLRQYHQALHHYSSAFLFNSGGYAKGDKYKVARAWARVGNKDSAFFALQQEITLGFTKSQQLSSEPAFRLLHKEKEWKQIIKSVRHNQDQLGEYGVIKEKLEKVFALDQKYRNRYQSVIDSFGFGSRKMRRLQKQMKAADKKNLMYVASLIDKYGWISYDSIGVEGSNALFMVIQHADSATQEKYLPVMREAVKQKKAFINQLAMLEDLVLVRRGSKQIYGTQVYWDKLTKKWKLSPIENEKDVDKRRAEVGLQPLKDYLKHFGIDY